MAHDPSAFIQEYFRIRKTDDDGLNDPFDAGDPAENTNTTIATGIPFRIRFKVRETAGGADSGPFKPQVNYEAGGFVDANEVAGTAATAALIVLGSSYADGDEITTERLTNTTTFVNGSGEEDGQTANYSLTSEETEIEWRFMFIGVFEGPNQTIAGDEVEFRLVENDGTVFAGTYTNPTITIAETDGHIGGASAESVQRLCHTDSNGNMYVIIADDVSEEDMMMMKSTDGGKTWREMDGTNRPTTVDLECVDSVVEKTNEPDSIHIAHQEAADDIYYHKFRMSDHATNADTWEITDQAVTTGIAATDQACAIEVRTDGDIVIFYRRTDGGEDIKYKINDGSWGSEQQLDAGTGPFTSVSCVRGESDKIHIFYKDGGALNILHQSLDSGDTLSGVETVEDDAQTGSGDKWGHTVPVYWDNGGVEEIMVVVHDESDGLLYSVVVSDDASPEGRKAASDNVCEEDQLLGRKPLASIANDGSTVHLLYGDTAFDIFTDDAINDGGWGTDTEERDAVQCDSITSWVFTHSSGNGGATVLGYLWDSGSGGNTGFLRYDEIVLAEGGRRIFVIGHG